MNGMYLASFLWTSTKKEWNARNLITRVLTIYHVKLSLHKGHHTVGVVIHTP